LELPIDASVHEEIDSVRMGWSVDLLMKSALVPIDVLGI
jgi:hypothetical protein